jgi:hypothetical protein
MAGRLVRMRNKKARMQDFDFKTLKPFTCKNKKDMKARYLGGFYYVDCDDGRWFKLDQDRAQWLTLVSEVLNFWTSYHSVSVQVNNLIKYCRAGDETLPDMRRMSRLKHLRL